jgi:hypothetical protein
MKTFLRIASVLCLCLIAFVGWLRYFSGLQSKSVSPDGDYVAVVRSSGSMSAMDADSHMVQVRSRWQLGRDLLFQASGDGVQVDLRWKGPKSLDILCHHCSDAHIDYQQSTWRDVTVSFKTD